MGNKIIDFKKYLKKKGTKSAKRTASVTDGRVVGYIMHSKRDECLCSRYNGKLGSDDIKIIKGVDEILKRVLSLDGVTRFDALHNISGLLKDRGLEFILDVTIGNEEKCATVIITNLKVKNRISVCVQKSS